MECIIISTKPIQGLTFKDSSTNKFDELFAQRLPLGRYFEEDLIKIFFDLSKFLDNYESEDIDSFIETHNASQEIKDKNFIIYDNNLERYPELVNNIELSFVINQKADIKNLKSVEVKHEIKNIILLKNMFISDLAYIYDQLSPNYNIVDLRKTEKYLAMFINV